VFTSDGAGSPPPSLPGPFCSPYLVRPLWVPPPQFEPGVPTHTPLFHPLPPPVFRHPPFFSLCSRILVYPCPSIPKGIFLGERRPPFFLTFFSSFFFFPFPFSPFSTGPWFRRIFFWLWSIFFLLFSPMQCGRLPALSPFSFHPFPPPDPPSANPVRIFTFFSILSLSQGFFPFCF